MDKVAQDSMGLNSLLRSSQAANVFMIMYVCLRADATYFSYYLPNIDWGNILDEGDDPGRLCHDDCRGTGRTRARNKQTPTIIPVRGHPSTPTVTANASTTPRASTGGTAHATPAPESLAIAILKQLVEAYPRSTLGLVSSSESRTGPPVRDRKSVV